jgi:hypothetical protein
MAPKPQLLSWITCDAVHSDPATGKHTILGIFSSIRATRFPVVHPSMVWFLALTGCAAGEHQVRISMGPSASTTKELLARTFASQGPQHRITIINEIRGLSFPAAGDYAVVIQIDDTPLLITSLSITA